MTDHNDPAGEGSRAARERELLSALMDGEAGEHELRQALKTVGDHPELLETWSRWHVAQSVLRGENVRPASFDLRAAVAAAIDGEPAVPVAAPVPAPAVWLRPLAGFAVAASVALVTVFGWQMLGAGAPDASTLAAGGESQQTVALGPMVVVREDGEELAVPTTAESPTAGQDRLNAYLARHAQAARGVAPYARVVSFEGEQGR